MATLQRISPCLWFDSHGEEAANFYVGIFPNSRIVKMIRYGKEGFEVHGRPAGSVLTVDFELDGQRFTALNGGPMFKFTEAVSLQDAAGSRLLLGQAHSRGRSGGPAMRLAQGQVRPFVAGRAGGGDRDAE